MTLIDEHLPAVPLPDCLRWAGLELRPVEPGDVRVWDRLGIPLLKVMAGNREKANLDAITHGWIWSLLFQFTRPLPLVDAALRNGREAFLDAVEETLLFTVLGETPLTPTLWLAITESILTHIYRAQYAEDGIPPILITRKAS